MKPASTLVVALILSSATLFAQSAASFGVAGMEGLNSPSGQVTGCVTQLGRDAKPIPCPVSPPACPVGLLAWHSPDGDLVKTGIAHPKGVGQALQLSISSPKGRAIAAATLDIRGWTPRGRLSQVAADSKGSAVRRLHVRLAPGADKSNVSDYWVTGFWVEGLSAVTSIELVSLTYADGSSWGPSGATTCSVAPNLFMPVVR